MNVIWGIIIIISVICGIATGRVDSVANAAMSGAADGITLFITMAGMMCLWSGLMKIASVSGVTKAFSRLISPLLRLLFPGVKRDSEAAGAISMSMAANFLGLGSAATPLGLTAMNELYKSSSEGVASDDMVMLVVLNTASIELIPTTVAVYRAAAGSSSPLSILPCVWIASVISVSVGVTAAKLLSKRRRCKNE